MHKQQSLHLLLFQADPGARLLPVAGGPPDLPAPAPPGGHQEHPHHLQPQQQPASIQQGGDTGQLNSPQIGALSFESAFLPNQIDFRVEPVLIFQNLSRYLISLGQLVHNLDIIPLISMLTTSLESSPLNYGL